MCLPRGMAAAGAPLLLGQNEGWRRAGRPPAAGAGTPTAQVRVGSSEVVRASRLTRTAGVHDRTLRRSRASCPSSPGSRERPHPPRVPTRFWPHGLSEGRFCLPRAHWRLRPRISPPPGPVPGVTGDWLGFPNRERRLPSLLGRWPHPDLLPPVPHPPPPADSRGQLRGHSARAGGPVGPGAERPARPGLSSRPGGAWP